MSTHSDIPASLWADTAPAAPTRPAPHGRQRADVLVVGGGFTGLSTALALAVRGIHVRLVEAQRIGWGASGRNGGQVIPGLKYDPEQLIERYGSELGQRMIDVSGRNADVVFELIQRHRIECDSRRQGWLQPASTQAGVARIDSRARQWEKHGVGVEWLNQTQCTQRLGTSTYLSAWRDPRAGSLNPLAFARGLARAAEETGATLHENSRVMTLTRHADGWHAVLDNGSEVMADEVLMCTNGYTGALHEPLSRSLIAANSFQIATRALTEAEGHSILSQGEVASDARQLLFYFRRDASGRFLLGGRGPFHDARGPRDFRHLINTMGRMYPLLKGIEIDYAWGGRIALTRDAMPHVHQPAPGLTIALGYNGRGIGMATHLGKLIGESLGKTHFADSLPFPIRPIQPIPLHGLQQLYVATAIHYYRVRDWLDR